MKNFIAMIASVSAEIAFAETKVSALSVEDAKKRLRKQIPDVYISYCFEDIASV